MSGRRDRCRLAGAPPRRRCLCDPAGATRVMAGIGRVRPPGGKTAP
jgi:hypothetical protein